MMALYERTVRVALRDVLDDGSATRLRAVALAARALAERHVALEARGLSRELARDVAACGPGEMVSRPSLPTCG